MRVAFGDILALLCGVAGWFYLFYSKAAARLSYVELKRDNALRVSLRRICGAAMFLLCFVLYVAINAVDDQTSPRAFLIVWLAVLLLLLVIVPLSMIDLRLTAKLRHRIRSARDHRGEE
jgi:L-asparagine transporter-like permease